MVLRPIQISLTTFRVLFSDIL